MATGPEGTIGFHYAEGAAPFGSMDFILPKRSQASRSLPLTIALAAGDTIADAWAESEWLSRYVPAERLHDPAYLDDQPFVTGMQHNAEQAYHQKNHTFAMAVRPPHIEELLAEDHTDFRPIGLRAIDTRRIIGVGNAKVDISGNALQRSVKRTLIPGKVYGCLSNVDVNPEFQGQHIGAALMYRLLGTLPQDKKTTVYVAGQNDTLIEKLGGLDYHITGSSPRRNLLRGVEIEEVRMQAESSQLVREKLAGMFTWLDQCEEFAVEA